ncbi:MAG: slipin family protein [Oscillospiraceae bacterium]|nr:slipin family protein [Oscillospiraceae bacterium]
MKITIQENERGFRFKNGVFDKMLSAGVYYVFGQTSVRKTTLDKPLHAVFDRATLQVFAKDSDFKAQTVTEKVEDGTISLHYVDGRFHDVLDAGVYTYWNAAEVHTFQHYSTASPEIPDDLSPSLCEQLHKAGKLTRLLVGETQVGLLHFNNHFERVLPAGRYYFWADAGVTVGARFVTTTQQELSLTGQEILTKDKVGVRLNFVCSYRITDPLKSFQEIDNVEAQFHTAVQLTVREYVTGVTLDELLASRDTIAESLLESLRPKAEKLYIAVEDAGIRDIILPGDVRDIMNTVLIAEKRAQANVITRREEVASTRSLLNTAKLMDENKTLYKLKELEYLEKICENVGNISVSGGDLLAQLREIVGSKE